MKQLVLIISFALFVKDGISQHIINGCSEIESRCNAYYIRYGYVDYYEYLKIPRGVNEEEFLSELDKFFRSIGIEKGYIGMQLYGFDLKRGTFYMVEFFHDLTQPINSNHHQHYLSETIIKSLEPEFKLKK